MRFSLLIPFCELSIAFSQWRVIRPRPNVPEPDSGTGPRRSAIFRCERCRPLSFTARGSAGKRLARQAEAFVTFVSAFWAFARPSRTAERSGGNRSLSFANSLKIAGHSEQCDKHALSHSIGEGQRNRGPQVGDYKGPCQR